MTGWSRRRVWAVVAGVAAVAVIAGVAVAYVRRITPPWPAVAGNSYEIRLDADGCPVVEDRYEFVDAPGPLVPPGATEVVLCATPTGLVAPRPDDPPRQRVLRTGAADFAALLNGLPDRNEAWRQWQREHSGWWPDAAPERGCLMIGYSHDLSFVLRYPDRPPVPLVYTCGRAGDLTSGARTRMDDTKPHLADEFLRRFEQQR